MHYVENPRDTQSMVAYIMSISGNYCEKLHCGNDVTIPYCIQYKLKLHFIQQLNIASIGVAIPGQANHTLSGIHLMRSCGTFVNVEATPDSNDNRLTDITLF